MATEKMSFDEGAALILGGLIALVVAPIAVWFKLIVPVTMIVYTACGGSPADLAWMDTR